MIEKEKVARETGSKIYDKVEVLLWWVGGGEMMGCSLARKKNKK
jgi:hypothetical protein